MRQTRFSDKYWGYLEKIWIIPVPHHWIWGALLIIIGIFFKSLFWGISCISFGLGHLISDLNDLCCICDFSAKNHHTNGGFGILIKNFLRHTAYKNELGEIKK